MLGFHVRFGVAELDEGRREALLGAFIAMIEANGLQFGGGGRDEWSGFAEAGGGAAADVTEAQRRAVAAWLAARPDADNPRVSGLIDLNDDEQCAPFARGD